MVVVVNNNKNEVKFGAGSVILRTLNCYCFVRNCYAGCGIVQEVDMFYIHTHHHTRFKGLFV